MDSQLITVMISGLVSLTGAFGSILLKDHLDQRREARKAVQPTPPSVETNAAGPAAEAVLPQAAPRPSQVVKASAVTRGTAIVMVATTMMAGFLGGAGVGSSNDRIFGIEPDLVALAALVAATLGLLIFYIRPSGRSPLGYQLSALTLWSAFFAGLSATGSDSFAELLTPMLVLGGGASAVGIVAFAIANRR